MKKIWLLIVLMSLIVLWWCNNKEIDCSIYKAWLKNTLSETEQISDLFYSNKLKTCVYEYYVDYFTTEDACNWWEYWISVILYDINKNELSNKNWCPNPWIRYENDSWTSKDNMKPYSSVNWISKYSDIREYIQDYEKYDNIHEELKN